MIRIKKEAPNVREHTNGDNATIANFVDLRKPRLALNLQESLNGFEGWD